MDQIIATATQVEPCHYSVVVTVPAARVAKAVREVQGQFRQYAQVPGFRSGVAPDKVLKLRFGNQIKKEAREVLVRQGFESLMKGEHKPASMPTFVKGQEGEVVEGREFAFAVEYDVLPAFELPAYKGLALRKAQMAVDDEMVAKSLADLAQRRTTWEKCERPAAAGDTVKVSYTGTLPDGSEVPEAAARLLKAEETWLQLSEPEMIPGVTTLLTGQAAGAEVAHTVAFPADYHEPTLAGKTAQYSFKLLEVHGSIVPAMDDELAKALGAKDLEDLKRLMRANFTQRQQQAAESHLRSQVTEALMKGFACELPPRLLRGEETRAMQELLQREQEQQQGQEELLEEESQRKARVQGMVGQAREMATQRLRYRILVERIAELEKLEVTDEEIAQTLEQYLMQRGMTVAQFEKENDVQAVRGRILEALLRDKVEQKILSLATVTEVPAEVLAAEAAAAEAATKAELEAVEAKLNAVKAEIEAAKANPPAADAAPAAEPKPAQA